MPQRLRIFVSSPTDVPDERLRADLVADKLSQDYSRFFTIESYRWEHEAMIASKHFQDAIEPPSAFDIVVLILWSRLGTPLPEKTAEREYRGIDGRAPVTGTEWEYEEALKVAREKNAPDLLAFRNINPAPIDTRDPEVRAQSNAQLDALDDFWRRHFADRGMFLAAYDEYRTLEQFAHRLEESLRKLIERRIKEISRGPSHTEPIWLGDPFRGLESYEFEHAPIFFGRDGAVMKATEQLATNARSGRAFLLVSGASGSGKSSLVKAGIVPRLMKPQRISGMAFLRRTVFRPGTAGADVVLGLAKALTSAGGEGVGLSELIAPGLTAEQLATLLRAAASEPGYLFALALRRLTDAGRKSGRLLAFEDAKLILIVDQLEELFTVSGISAEDRRLFFQLVAGLARSRAVWVIATLRADFWHRAAEIPELIAFAEGKGRIDLAASSPAELTEMIRKPAHAAGLSFQAHPKSGLALDAVLTEHAAAAPGALPLLSFTLDELYRNAKARGEAVLTHASYEALGGLEGAIAKRADEIVAGLPAVAQAVLPRALRALTTVTEAADQAPVARSAPLESFPNDTPARALIDAFVEARLLVAASEGGAATVRLAHEALISRWKRARDQLAADRRDLETRALVERQFGRWSHARGYGRQRLLLRNPDLANAVDLAQRWGDELGAPMRDFIKRSGRRARLAQTLTAAAAALMALLFAAAYWQRGLAIEQRMAAQEQRSIAEKNEAQAEEQRNITLLTQSRFLADVANQRVAADDAGTGLLLALEALPDANAGADRPYAAEAERALFSARQSVRKSIILSGHGVNVLSAMFSPDGRRVLTASNDNDARIWDAVTGKPVLVLTGHTNGIASAAFSPDGRKVITASSDRTAVIWSAETGHPILILHHPARVRHAVFSPDGTRVATASEDKAARIWDAQTGQMLMELVGHSDEVWGLDFSNDGRRLLTGSEDKTVRVWDVDARKVILTLNAGTIVWSAVFSPDGQRILTGGFDRIARIWDAGTGRAIMSFPGHTEQIRGVAFSADGRRIATASDDTTVRIWDVESGRAIAVVQEHSQKATSVAFSPDGKRVVTTAEDGTARILDLENDPSSRVLEGHSETVVSATFSPDGRRVLTASMDGARIWEAYSGTLISSLSHPGALLAAYSAKGNRVITASLDGTARVWSLDPIKTIAVLQGHTGYVSSAQFNRAGDRVITAGQDGTARIWNAITGDMVAVLNCGSGNVWNAVFSPDGLRAVTAGNIAKVWDLKTKQVIVELDVKSSFTSVGFSPDGTRIITASPDRMARIWDAASGRLLLTLNGHTDEVWDAAFSSDGRRVITASNDRTARIWDSMTGAAIAILIGHSGKVFKAVLSPSGDLAVTGSWDGTARIWKFYRSTEDLVDDAKRLTPRCLTPAERRRWFLDPGPPSWCIEKEKWPYDTQKWRDWLVSKRSGLAAPLPDTSE